MRSYPLFIDGVDHDTDRWVYTMRASALLEDPAGVFALKRALELGELTRPDDRVAGRVAVGGDHDNERAVAAAHRARDRYGETPLDVRREIGRDFHDAVLDRADELVALLVAEGHPRRLAEWEVSGILQGCSRRSMDWYFGELERAFDEPDRLLMLVRKPDGVVCLNPPQNAAGSCSALGVASLLAGNTLVVKAPRSSPLSVMFLYREIVAPILDRWGAPRGTLNLVCGDTRRILRGWLDSPMVDDVMFFGASDVGLALGADCVARGKKPVLELAGNDGLVVWRDADLDSAADALAECFYGSSQICMVPNYALVHPEIADALLERVLERAAALVPGLPDDPDVLLSPVLKADGFFDLLAEAQQAGGEVLCGGTRLNLEGEESADGVFLAPTIVRVSGLEQARALRCVGDETFFPLLPVVVPEECDDPLLLDDMIAFVNENRYGLRNSLWASDPEVIHAFVSRVRNGGLLKVNESHIAFPPILATHGGTGRTGGPGGELNYPILRTSHLQGVCIARTPVPLTPV